MPVKIVNSVTNSLTGEINQNDLNTMKSDFQGQVQLNPTNGRVNVVKKFAWYVTKEDIDELLAVNNGLTPSLLEISFAVHLDQSDVCGNSLTDSLTVVLQGTDDQKNPLDTPEKFVVIPGYDSFPGAVGQINVKSKGCCPSSNP